jgi:plastocyanin
MANLHRGARRWEGPDRPRAAAARAGSRRLGAALSLVFLFTSTAGRAAEAKPPTRTSASENAAELARVDRELRELRATLGEVQRSEREHFEIVRRLLDRSASRAGGTSSEATSAPAGAMAGAKAGDRLAAGVSNETGGAAANATGQAALGALTEPTSTAPHPPAPIVLATVTGRVRTQGPIRDVYVYLEGFRSNAGRKAELEIVQTHKSFEPPFAVALAGTRATFPNRDTFFHNVFSPSPAPFDLGTYRADEKSPGVTLNSPGVVEIFCNIHSQMQAQILVVPNRVYARVAEDGTFRLDKVPAGRRKLVAWGPTLRPVRLEVTVPAGGTHVSFDLEPAPPVRHPNKFGLPYGAYKD